MSATTCYLAVIESLRYSSVGYLLLGTHQGAVSHEHLPYYLDEYTFRFNRRTSHHRGKPFHRLVQQSAVIESALIKHVRGPREHKL